MLQTDLTSTNGTISVIIPVYNAERWLRECLDSVLAQSLCPLEVIAVNDGSTDGSCKILDEYTGRIIVIDQANAGASAARNHAAQIARGEWLAFIDSDDVWEPAKLKKQMLLLTQHPSAVGTYCDLRVIDHVGQTVKSSEACEAYWPSGEIFIPLLLGRLFNCFSPSQAIVRRSAYLKCGGFPEGQRHAEDWALWLKLSLLGPILYSIEPLIGYRRHKNSVSREADSDFGRLEARYQTLLEIKSMLKRQTTNDVVQKLGLLDYELHQCSMALGYHRRLRGSKVQARKAYAMALRLKPMTLRGYLGYIRSFV